MFKPSCPKTRLIYYSNEFCKLGLTLPGKASKELRTGLRQPKRDDLNLRMMSCRVAATRKYSCLSNELLSKN
ncbi:hypothetical protein DPMN_175081 [Dreissena polymorpha]|uniref:Uncharacterized protein n=1 Tax=Dreissena polymorpha TaxID=45954 RepID=A0A9D4E6K1_DREPO|nr:hypothetical protein DPMN_175081 [Dreissena polymorpha]